MKIDTYKKSLGYNKLIDIKSDTYRCIDLDRFDAEKCLLNHIFD